MMPAGPRVGRRGPQVLRRKPEKSTPFALRPRLCSLPSSVVGTLPICRTKKEAQLLSEDPNYKFKPTSSPCVRPSGLLAFQWEQGGVG